MTPTPLTLSPELFFESSSAVVQRRFSTLAVRYLMFFTCARESSGPTKDPEAVSHVSPDGEYHAFGQLLKVETALPDPCACVSYSLAMQMVLSSSIVILSLRRGRTLVLASSLPHPCLIPCPFLLHPCLLLAPTLQGEGAKCDESWTKLFGWIWFSDDTL